MASEVQSHRPDRIHFGSCNSQHHEQVLWPHMSLRSAAGFVWAGDAIYGDDLETKIDEDGDTKMKASFLLSWLAKLLNMNKQVREATPVVLQKLYGQQLQNAVYRKFLSSQTPPVILGTFDDHDYGHNNGDLKYKWKRESAVAYMDFIEESNRNLNLPGSPWIIMKERAAQGKGVYGVKVFDFSRPVGQQLLTDAEAGLDPAFVQATADESSPKNSLSEKSVAIFLLDCRSNKTPWIDPHTKEKKIKSLIDYQGDFLGEEQWAWFEQAIGRSAAAVNIVVQGLQVHPDRYFDGHVVENWSRFPMAQHRLYQAVLKPNVQAPILISGDIHMAEVLRRDCRRVVSKTDGPEQLEVESDPRLLLEATSSGMTHSWGTQVCARPKESHLCNSTYFQMSMRAGMHLAHHSGAWTDLVTLGRNETQEGAKSGAQYSLGLNFGEFEFDWEKRQVIFRILGQDSSAPPVLSTTWDFDTLSGRTPAKETGFVRSADYREVFGDLELHGIAASNDWICVNYRGVPSEQLQLFGAASPMVFSMSLLLIPIVFPALLACFMMRSGRPKKSLSK